MYIEQPLQQYLDDLASKQPAPGGGSASALSGAMGAALASMVVRLTLGKTENASAQREIEEMLHQTEQLRLRFQQLIQEDIEAYGNLSASFKMPRETAEEKTARSSAIQERLLKAALVPLEIAERAAELAGYCQRIAEIGNVTVLSDIATGVMLANGAASGAGWMVQVNIRSMDNPDLAQALGMRLKASMNSVKVSCQKTLDTVGSRM